MISCNSVIKLNLAKIAQLSEAQVMALEQTAEALHTEVVQKQVMPRDTGAMQGEKTFIKAGEETVSTYKDGTTATNSITKAKNGKVSLVTTSPQVRRLYFHPEYRFKKDENPNAGGKWYQPWIDGEYKDFCQNAYAELYRRIAGL